MNTETLLEYDKEVADALLKEKYRQNYHLELIASENYASRAVMEAQGSIFTNKYAEGLPGKRYYGGCENCDVVENLAIERVKKLFGAYHANVQPHSGASANLAVMLATLKPGDSILGMNLSHGGHLSHGSKVNISGIYFNSHFYGVDPKTGYIDYDELRKIALEVRPKMLISGFSAYPRKLDFAKFKQIADEVGAVHLADISHVSGLVVTGLYPSPIDHAQIITTTTHKTLRGPRGGIILSNEEYAKAIDKAVFPGTQGGPLEHIIAAKAIAFKEALEPSFKVYQQQVLDNAKCLADTLLSNGINLVSGGTDNHLLLIDLREKGLTGKAIEAALHEVNITVNKNTVPDDPKSPFVTSGIRIGTPALTTRGMKENEMKIIGEVISDVIHNPENNEIKAKSKERVTEICKDFEIYQDFYK
ncbi:MAG: serine hydroxymethyltransferase [Candidatus Sericytochromatia bacterium]|nr:serine hydroxymethyltransferase [Candidatus Sericytochromatia bacterium]